MITDSQNRIVRLLQTPAAYLHPVEGEVELIETHISWVFLAGDYAYKVKKPIKNSFLDYTTLELRKHYCDEELRLNQRFTRELYLGVIAIADHDGRLVVGGTGKAVEYAVKMKRFPKDALMSDRLVHDAVTLEDLRALAARIADFHQIACHTEASSRFGSPNLVYEEAIDNIREIEAAKIEQLSDILPELKRWTEQHFAYNAENFVNRKINGHVRECHGDLHLGNIVEWRNSMVPFDGIEFCDEFRWIDTLSDAAFTAMDLAAHGRMDFCHSFINAYLEAIGDYGSVGILRWYMVYRALVRAKVAAIRYSQTETNEVSHATAEEEITLLVKLARRFVHACDVQPRIWITHGVSGSGKTTGSEKILQRHGAIRIRADVERKRLLGMKPLDRVSEDDERAVVLYSEEMNTRTYQRLRDLTEEMIQGGTSVIVDATFLEKRRRSLFKSLADSLQVPFQILAFHAQPDALHQRIADRLVSNRDASDANLSVLASQMQTCQQLDDDELQYTIPYVDSP